MLVIAGTVKVKPETRAEAVKAALKMAKASAAEPGCTSYRFYADLEDADTFLIFEQWESEAALTAHFQTPHMAEFNAAIPRFLAAAPSINRYDVAAVAKLM
jgi:quinol monooxygenase YgiN